MSNGVVLACLLRSRGARWPLMILAAMIGNLAANLVNTDPWPVSIGLTMANAAEYVLSAWLLRRMAGRNIDLSTPRHLAVFGVICGLVAPLASAVIGAGVVGLLGSDDFLRSLAVWAIADALGLLTVAPCLLVLLQSPVRRLGREGLLLMALLAGVSTVVFGQSHYPLLFLIPPVLLLIAFRLEATGAAIGVAVTATIAMALTVLGHGPILLVTGEPWRQAIVLQTFLSISILMSLPVASLNTQRRRMESATALARDEAQIQAQRASMAETLAGLGSWRLDVARQTMSWSPQMFEIFGLDPALPLAKEAIVDALHPDDKAAALGRVEALMTTGQPPETAITRIVRPDGALRYLTAGLLPETDAEGTVIAIFGTVMDVTEQRLAELAVVESEARYRLLAENASDMIMQTGLDGRISYVSPSASAIVGFRREDLLGKRALKLIHPEDRARAETVVLEMLSGRAVSGPTRLECRAVHKDGRLRWIESHPSLAIDPKTGAIIGITDAVRDITDRKLLEAELREARAEAEAAAAVKAEFLANMSHELRTPLTAVLGFSRLVEEQPELSTETRSYVRRVTSAGGSLLATVNDILDFSKLEAGQVEIKPRPVAPAALALDAVELFSAQARDKGVSLTLSGLEALPAMVELDPDRLRQILLNLLGNAVKFTHAGTVSLMAAHDADAGRLIFAVQDSGPGIAPAQLARLFQRFSQVDASSTRQHGGTGLGLAICKGLAEAMGGEINAWSEPGQGSRFEVSLPARIVAAPAPEIVAPILTLPPGCRVLVADDNPANRALVQAVLTALAAEVTEATDGEVAVARAMETPFDVILMDLRMPRLDGWAAAAKIRTGGPNAEVPILAFSADTGAGDPGVDFDGVILKPVSVAGLVSSVARALDLPHQGEAHNAA